MLHFELQQFCIFKKETCIRMKIPPPHVLTVTSITLVCLMDCVTGHSNLAI